MRILKTTLLFVTASALVMCSPDDDVDVVPPSESLEEQSHVIFDSEAVPYGTLSEYGFFEGEMAALEPAAGVLPYDLITPLFTDYAKKKRFVWMADGSSASYSADHKTLNFADGSVLIKNFYYDDVLPDMNTRIIETRLLYKIDGNWQFAEYVWNDEQTEAHLDLSGSYFDIEWLDDAGNQRATNYRIPAEGECFTCHKTGTVAMPLGPKPQNIDKAFAYKDGVKNQLTKWSEVGYLSGSFPSEIDRLVPWDDPSELLSERVRSYLDVNCSSCHLEGSHCDYRPIRLAWNETAELENLGVCVEPDEMINTALIRIIAPGNPARSVMHYRMASVVESERMPLLGRSVVHDEGLELLTEYINSLTVICD
ncbi:MAG: hypothetical protein ABR572_06115 [Cryomorphaceae bacterium]